MNAIYSSERWYLDRKLREIIRVFLMLRPKNRYSTTPTSGSRISTVTHANDLTGLRFSLTITHNITITVMAYIVINV